MNLRIDSDVFKNNNYQTRRMRQTVTPTETLRICRQFFFLKPELLFGYFLVLGFLGRFSVKKANVKRISDSICLLVKMVLDIPFYGYLFRFLYKFN